MFCKVLTIHDQPNEKKSKPPGIFTFSNSNEKSNSIHMALQCINSIYPLVEWLTKAKFIIDLNPISFSEISLNEINERMVIHEIYKFFENIRCAKVSSIDTEQIQSCIEQALTINKFDPTSLIKLFFLILLRKI